jgi:hypothetical protein
VVLFARIEKCTFEDSRRHLDADPQLRFPDDAAAALAAALDTTGEWWSPSELVPLVAITPPAAPPGRRSRSLA